MSISDQDLSSAKGEEDMDINDIEGSGSIEVQYGPETRQQWRTRLTTKWNEV